ncbi:MAG TPA: nucleotide exchange factor GrpE [Nocardioidaceae bacterium]|nr:nucleotide exchange factor GrpE [Nocardioidaceae bacterium]
MTSRPDENVTLPDEAGEHVDGTPEAQETPASGTPGEAPSGAAPAPEQPAEDADNPANGVGPDDLGAELVGARSAVAALTNDLQRLQAEYVNYKRRVDRDRQMVKENATFSVLSAMLPVLDDLDRAREHGELEGGFKAVADSLERIVAAQGLVKFGKPGDEFDPRFHEALMHGHSPDVTTTTCQTIVSAGYQIGDRVVRPARVTVVDPEPKSEPESEPGPGPDLGPDAAPQETTDREQG